MSTLTTSNIILSGCTLVRVFSILIECSRAINSTMSCIKKIKFCILLIRYNYNFIACCYAVAKVCNVLYTCDTVSPCRVHVHMLTVMQFLMAMATFRHEFLSDETCLLYPSLFMQGIDKHSPSGYALRSHAYNIAYKLRECSITVT